MSEEITPSGTKQTSATTEETTTVSSESLGGVTEEMTSMELSEEVLDITPLKQEDAEAHVNKEEVPQV